MSSVDVKILALCDYLLGYWEYEVDDDRDEEKVFEEYFLETYSIDMVKTFHVGPYHFQRAQYALHDLLCNKPQYNRVCSLLLDSMTSSQHLTSNDLSEIQSSLERIYNSKKGCIVASKDLNTQV
jgi:hypothetical protein